MPCVHFFSIALHERSAPRVAQTSAIYTPTKFAIRGVAIDRLAAETMCAAPARRLSTHIVPCVLGSTAAAPPTGSRTADDAARGLLSDPGTPAGNPQPLSHSTAARRSKAAVAAATRDYVVKPRLEYRTVQGVNGPLVILEVRAARAPCAELMILCPRPPVRVFVAERAPSAVRRDRQPDPQRRHAALGPGAGGAGLQGRRPGLRGHVGH